MAKFLPSLVALLAGLLFGLGLTVSQMVDPHKVINFLDVAGHWDPSLAFVMMGALSVFGLGYYFVIKPRQSPVLESSFTLPSLQGIDKKLLTGAALFGIGWGLSGICPGPAMANLSTGSNSLFVFVVAMLAGIIMVRKLLP